MDKDLLAPVLFLGSAPSQDALPPAYPPFRPCPGSIDYFLRSAGWQRSLETAGFVLPSIRVFVRIVMGLKGHWDLWGRRWQQTRFSLEAWLKALVMPEGSAQIPKCFWKKAAKTKTPGPKTFNDLIPWWITMLLLSVTSGDCVQFPQNLSLLVQLKLYLHKISVNYLCLKREKSEKK